MLAFNLELFIEVCPPTAQPSVQGGVLHVELAQWADVLLVAPLSANSLAKLALGICDTLPTLVARCWHVGAKPMVVAPAMNTKMWEHPVTAGQLKKLQRWGVQVVDPIEKLLACGDKGVGAMAAVDVIAALTAQAGLQARKAANAV